MSKKKQNLLIKINQKLMEANELVKLLKLEGDYKSQYVVTNSNGKIKDLAFSVTERDG